MSDDNQTRISNGEILKMAVEIVSAYVSNNGLNTTQVPQLINTIYSSLHNLNGSTSVSETETLKPAVSVRRSINPDYIICLEDGKKLKMLKRHLRASYGITPDEYRAKWGLPADYPMVAPNYAEQRSNFAKKIGLGRKKGAKISRNQK